MKTLCVLVSSIMWLGLFMNHGWFLATVVVVPMLAVLMLICVKVPAHWPGWYR